MSIAILFESDEWSTYKILEEIKELGVSATLIDMSKPFDINTLSEYSLIVSRVFASSIFRGNDYALKQMPVVIDYVKEHGIPMINPPEAHFYEISKFLSTTELAKHEVGTPLIYGVDYPKGILEADYQNYPYIVKPDCGGRTNCTYIIRSHDDLVEAMSTAPEIKFIAQEYILPQYGFLTRIEVIDNECKLIVKRSVTESGLSSYNVGSVYDSYPDCSEEVKKTAVRAMEILSVECGSMDVIENDTGFYIIDVNSVSNTSEDCTELFNFDMLKELALYIVKRYHAITK